MNMESQHAYSYERDRERIAFQDFKNSEMHERGGRREQLRTTPLMSLAVKDTIMKETGRYDSLFDQYALLGFHAGQHSMVGSEEPILMNIDAPNSFFICGSQGSGKSYTLNCVLENCLVKDKRIGCVGSPITGIAFHYDMNSAEFVAETAYLCSLGVRVRVLVSQSNEHSLRQAYDRLPGARDHLTVEPLLLHPSDLSVERMHRLMAFSDNETAMPLYMSVALQVLRRMAIEAKGRPFDYLAFKRAMESQNLTKEQLSPLNLRLGLLESFLNMTEGDKRQNPTSLFSLDPGSLTILDLTDPFLDSGTACILFDICLSLIQERRPSCGMIVVLDEAHKYMTTSPASLNFTQRLLGTIREQRHNGTRVVVATQEPTISQPLLDLCTTSIIHRFTSPAWFKSIRNHLGAASALGSNAAERQTMFEQIMELGVGESLLFSPAATLFLTDAGEVCNLGGTALEMRTRTRVGRDGGMSILAATRSRSSANNRRPLHIVSDRTACWNSCTEDSVALGDALRATADIPDDGTGWMKGPAFPFLRSDRHPARKARSGLLDQMRSHLVAICCLCERLVVLEFSSRFLPDINGVIKEGLRGGIAYATCVQCQLQTVPESKKASKAFDAAKGRDFVNGALNPAENLCDDVRISFRLILNYDLPVLKRNGHASYLFARILQRSIRDGALLFSVHVCRNEETGLQARVLPHQDGTFFKISLQPDRGVAE